MTRTILYEEKAMACVQINSWLAARNSKSTIIYQLPDLKHVILGL